MLISFFKDQKVESKLAVDKIRKGYEVFWNSNTKDIPEAVKKVQGRALDIGTTHRTSREDI